MVGRWESGALNKRGCWLGCVHWSRFGGRLFERYHQLFLLEPRPRDFFKRRFKSRCRRFGRLFVKIPPRHLPSRCFLGPRSEARQLRGKLGEPGGACFKPFPSGIMKIGRHPAWTNHHPIQQTGRRYQCQRDDRTREWRQLRMQRKQGRRQPRRLTLLGRRFDRTALPRLGLENGSRWRGSRRGHFLALDSRTNIRKSRQHNRPAPERSPWTSRTVNSRRSRHVDPSFDRGSKIGASTPCAQCPTVSNIGFDCADLEECKMDIGSGIENVFSTAGIRPPSRRLCLNPHAQKKLPFSGNF